MFLMCLLKLKQFLSKIFFSKKDNCYVKYNLFFSCLFFLMLFLPDFFLIISNRISLTFNFQNSVYVFVFFIAGFCLSFCNVIFKLLLILIIQIFQIANINYIYYSGNPMGVGEVYNAFFEASDVLANFGAVWVCELFLFIPLFCLLFYTIKYRNKFIKSYLFFLLILLSCCKFLSMAKTDDYLWAIPNRYRINIINSLRTFTYTILHFNQKTSIELPDVLKEEPVVKLVNKNSPRFVILFWGESTNVDFMSSFGKTRYTENIFTTPQLQSLIDENKDKFLTMRAISGSISTRASTTIFFNMIKTPTNFKVKDEEKKQHLFTLAKQNGYTTYFLSAAGTNVTEAGGIKADFVITKDTHPILPDKDRDDYLLNEFKKFDFSEGKHFVVVQFNSAHPVYKVNYANHPEFEVSKVNESDTKIVKLRKEYSNNIFFLDYLLSEVIKHGQKYNVDDIIYTSDHGQALGTDEEGKKDGMLFGHNLFNRSDINVPFLIYQKKPDKQLFNKLRDKKIISHNEISKLVANIIGYEVVNPQLTTDDEFFVYGSTLHTKDIDLMTFKRQNDGKLNQTFKGLMEEFINDLVKKK